MLGFLCLILVLPPFSRGAPQAVVPATEDYSGMYSFLREGVREIRYQQSQLYHRKRSWELVHV